MRLGYDGLHHSLREWAYWESSWYLELSWITTVRIVHSGNQRIWNHPCIWNCPGLRQSAPFASAVGGVRNYLEPPVRGHHPLCWNPQGFGLDGGSR